MVMGSKNFEREYDWSRSLSERIKGMKDTALAMVWRKGREQKIREIELLRTYNWLISAGFPQYVQLHRDNQGLINAIQVEQENFSLEKFMMETLLKRVSILNQHVKTKFSDSTDIESLTSNNDDFNFSLSTSWLIDRSISKWMNLSNGLERSCGEDESTLKGKSGGERCTCHGEAINQSPSSHSPFPGGSPARKPKKKRSEGKKKNKSLRVEEDATSSDNTFSTPVNSSLNSSDFKANQNSSHEVETSEDQEKGGTLLFCGAVRGDQEAKLESRKASLQSELNRSSHLRQQYKSLKNFFKSVGDRISSAKSSKVPRYCNECNGGNETTRLANSFSSNSRRASKSATCSDSFLMLDSGCLPDIRIFGSRENTHKRYKSENCLACNSRRRPWFNVRRSAREGRPPDAPRSASLSRRSVTPTSSRYERMNNASNSNNKTLLSLEMPRRRFSNSTNNSPKILTESMKISPFRKMITVPDKMERLSGDNSSLDNSIPLYFNNSSAPTRPFLAGDGKSNTDDSSYYECFEGSSNCLSDNQSGALTIDEKNDRFGSSSFAGCNGSQSEESKKSSYQSLETSKNFRQKELDSILRELYNKINTLDKIRFDVERESANLDGQPCPHSNSPNVSDQLEDEVVFRTFSMEKAKFFNLDQNCLVKTAKACDKCRRQLSNLKCSNDSEKRESKERKTSLNSGQKRIRQIEQHGPGNDKRPAVLKTDLSLLTASELFVLRKVSLIHLTSITDKYLLSNVDNLLAPKPDSKLAERRDSAWISSEKNVKIFGSSLLDVVRNFGQPLPGTIGRALAFLSFVGGDAVGIFRRPGVKTRISDIKAQLDDDPDVVDFHNQSVYDVADLVKLYFRELPGSLFTREYSQLLINIFSYVPQDLHLSALRDVMCLLPDENRVVLRHLLCFLHNLSKFSDTNQMDINNLATCFAPSLFHSTNQQGVSADDSFVGQGCWDHNGSANGKKGQTMPLHHSHPHSTMHRNVHQTSSNSADYVREATEMKDHKATKECLVCLITNAHLVFQVSDELSQIASNFVYSRPIEPNFSDMLANRDNCLSAFLKESISSTIHDVDNNLSGWLPMTNLSLDIEVYFKPGHTLNQAKESHLLGTFVASTFIPVQPKEAMKRIACEREHWDDTLLSWNILEEVKGINVDESELRADIQADISRMAKNSDIPTIIEENIGEFSGKFEWGKILGFNSYSGDVAHYTVSFAPGSDLEYCEMRLWQSSDSASVLLSTSVDHPSIPPSSDVRCQVMDCRYVVVSVNNDTSKVYYFSQVDLKGHLPNWYEKVYGNLCANHLKKLLASFDESL